MPPKRTQKNKSKKANDDAPTKNVQQKKHADEKVSEDGDDDEVDDKMPASRNVRARGNRLFLFNEKQPNFSQNFDFDAHSMDGLFT